MTINAQCAKAAERLAEPERSEFIAMIERANRLSAEASATRQAAWDLYHMTNPYHTQEQRP
jgi:hypothetical protein